MSHVQFTEKETGGRDGETERGKQTDRQAADWHADRQTGRQTHTHTHTHTHRGDILTHLAIPMQRSLECTPPTVAWLLTVVFEVVCFVGPHLLPSQFQLRPHERVPLHPDL